MVYSRNKICDVGYYCVGGTTANTAGATTPHPNVEADKDTIGYICQPGTYCPANSHTPIFCPGGEFETREGSDECQECPEGYYCNGDETATSVAYIAGTPSTYLGTQIPLECSDTDGFIGYCPSGSIIPELCPAGRFSNSTLTKMVSIEDCVYCPEGKYCDGVEGTITGDCLAGYFCDFGATLMGDISKICPKGHYCPAGTNLPIRCDEGWYYPATGAESYKDCRPCEAGFYCIENDSVSRSCPVGHYCSAITTEPTPCRAGTY